MLDYVEGSWRSLALGSATMVLLALVSLAWPGGPRRTTAGEPAEHRIDVSFGSATVYVNGRRMGLTPLSYVGTAGDVIDVELRLDGYETRRERVEVRPNGTTTFTMERRKDLP